MLFSSTRLQVLFSTTFYCWLFCHCWLWMFVCLCSLCCHLELSINQWHGYVWFNPIMFLLTAYFEIYISNLIQTVFDPIL